MSAPHDDEPGEMEGADEFGLPLGTPPGPEPDDEDDD